MPKDLRTQSSEPRSAWRWKLAVGAGLAAVLLVGLTVIRPVVTSPAKPSGSETARLDERISNVEAGYEAQNGDP